jgi:4-oxalomesaconate tautomerase
MMFTPPDPVDGIACMIMRGGTSKGAYFLRDHLPGDITERDRLLLELVGSPDTRQIDGIGGAHPLTTKVAIVERLDGDRADVGYLFLQPSVDKALISDSQNCGNLLAGVGPFALERGLVDVAPDATEATVRILMHNTDSVATAVFPVRAGRPRYSGDTAISGVPNTAAAVRLDFEDIAGGSCGALLPTGSPVDEIDGVVCTLIDNGMPVVVMRADAFGITGYESCADLDGNDVLQARLESIRLQAGTLMNLGDVKEATVPKLALVAPPADDGDLCTRSFIPHQCHDAIGVLAAVSIAAAALLPGTPAASVSTRHSRDSMLLEHPTGTMATAIELDTGPDGATTVRRAGIIRTARKLMDGCVFSRTGQR